VVSELLTPRIPGERDPTPAAAGPLDRRLVAWASGDLFIDARAPLSREDVARRLAEEIRCDAEHGVQYWPIFLLANGEHVGCCGLKPRDPRQRIFAGHHPENEGSGRLLAKLGFVYTHDELYPPTGSAILRTCCIAPEP
jgi:[ribosomal protein S5]-alanine N-acetyltransferase